MRSTFVWRSSKVTSVSKRLFPQEIAEFLGPSFLYILAGALQRVRVSGLSFPKPYLELRRGISYHRCQSNVRCLYAVLVDVDIKVLQKKKKIYNPSNYIILINVLFLLIKKKKKLNTNLSIREPSCLAEQYQIFEEKNLSETFLAFALPNQKLVLTE